MNAVRSIVVSAVTYALACLAGDDMPANAGLLRWFGRLVAVLLGGGFCLVSLALAWGAQP